MENQNCAISAVTRKRLETQGYLGFTDAQLNDFKFGIRFAYYLCGLLVLTGLILSRVEILLTVMAVALFAVIPPYHPFDYLYNYGVRQLLHKPKLPPRANQGRFACAIAAVWVGGIILLFTNGLKMWAYIAGGMLLVVAGLVSVFDICIPSMIYNLLFKQQTVQFHSKEKIQ